MSKINYFGFAIYLVACGFMTQVFSTVQYFSLVAMAFGSILFFGRDN